MHRLRCSEIWGGIKNTDVDVCSVGMTVSLFSTACDGGKGGDVYYFSVCGADRVTRFVLADVVGHGEAVSRISEWVYRQMAARLDSPDLPAMLVELNQRIVDRGFGAMTTAAVLSYSVDGRHVHYSYAGHPPMLSHNGGGDWTEVSLPATRRLANMPLGVDPAADYDLGKAAFAKGDRLFLFSDGVIEAPNENGDLFGTERLRTALAEAGHADPMTVKTHVLTKLRQWTSGPLDHDDVTLIVIQLA